VAHSLDGARLKIVWAQHHLGLFKKMAGEYKEGKLDKFVFKLTGKSVNASLREVASPPPPKELRCIVGDCVTNARAALDYVMWELASRYFVPCIDLKEREDRRISAFHLYPNPGDKGYIHWLNCLTNRKIPTGAIDVIKDVQPHNAGYEPLWQLHEIVNGDKHRLPVLITTRIKPIGPMSLAVTSEGGRRDIVVGVGVQNSLEIDTSQITGNFKVEVDSQATIFVAFSDSSMPLEPVDRTLENIIKCVANVIPQFDSFF
jgi:hypothetical protein